VEELAIEKSSKQGLSCSEGAPIPNTHALRKAAHAWILWALGCGCLDWDSCGASGGGLAVGAARTKMLPLAERAMATVACAMHYSIWVEACKFIETDQLGRVLPAEDAATLSAVVASLEEAEGLCARGRRTYGSGAVGLNRCVSTIGLELIKRKGPIGDHDMNDNERPPCIG
jgi:hypothetical protein